MNVVSNCVLAERLKRTNRESSSAPTSPKKFCLSLQSMTPSPSLSALLSHMLLGMACIRTGTQELVPHGVPHEHHEHPLLSAHPREYLLNHIVGIATIQNWSNRQGEWLSKAWCKPYPVWFLGWFHTLLYDNTKVAGNMGLREVCPFWEVEAPCLNFYCYEQKFHDGHNWCVQQPLPPTVFEGHVLTGCPCSFSSFLPNAGSAIASQWAGTSFTNRCQTYIFLPLLFKELPFTGTFLQVLQDVLDDNRLKDISWDWHGYGG